MSVERVDVVIAGAGVVGLAVARALSLTGCKPLVIESQATIGTGASSRNSEVIHAGLFYPPGSLKARLCVEGRERLYAYCDARGVPHRRLGKLIVATEQDQQARLEGVARNALECGVQDLVLKDAAEVRAMEPALSCMSALHSPSTGIIDSHAYMLALQGEAEANDAQFVFNTRIVGGEITANGVRVDMRDDRHNEQFSVVATDFVNAAGLDAPALARRIDGFPQRAIPRAFFARGCYFMLAGRAPFSRLVYPLPVEGGLGVHLTLDLAGAARFGPDVEWIDRVDYEVDKRRADAFYAEIRRYWPALKDGALSPGYAGVRPKISGPGEAAADFRIDGPRQHGVPGVVNLFGIESPGLTASLAIADEVCRCLED